MYVCMYVCPVELLKQYLSRRPLELRNKGPFYLAIIENHKTNVWYKKQRLSVNSIDNMMKSVVKNTALETSKKKLTNHTARKTVVKKLRAASVERQSIIQVTGHASEKSLNASAFPLCKNFVEKRRISGLCGNLALQGATSF